MPYCPPGSPQFAKMGKNPNRLATGVRDKLGKAPHPASPSLMLMQTTMEPSAKLNLKANAPLPNLMFKEAK